ncbi:unnamed protein product, partial [Oppiella nova]
HYYATNSQIPGPYFSPVPNGTPIAMTSHKEMNKMRASGPGVGAGKSSKSNHNHNDIRQPFYPPSNPYPEVPQLIDPNRAPVTDGMGPQMFTPGYPGFLPHGSPFPPPPMYIIATPEGSFITYGVQMATPGVQMPRPSSPHTVPNVDSDSANACKVPSNDGNGSNCSNEPLDEDINDVSDEPIDELALESNDYNEDNEMNDTETHNHINNETNVEFSETDVNCVNPVSEPEINVIVKDVTNTTSAAISTQTTSSTTAAAPVVWGSS